ncbi:MAG TPA: radical SAM protein [Candidatus Glassbacteria bacterium]|nr:radical SAM protein [Candidatus Glassbacteria bacterium]
MSGLLRLARNGLEYLLRRRELSVPPMQVSIEPTNVCNFCCAFCPQSSPEHSQIAKGRMELESCRKLLERLAREFYPQAVHRKVSFTHDGEPFVHPDFPEFLEAAAALEFQIKFASNGLLATPALMDRLIAKGVRFNIWVDFCADRETFERIRGRAGSHEKILANLRHLLERAKESGAVSLDVCDITGFVTADPAGRRRNLELMKSLFAGLESIRTKFSSRVFHNMAGTVEIPGKRAKAEGTSYRVCPYPWFNLNVAWDGRVVSCCRDLRAKTVLGNVFETESLWEVWNGEPYRELRRALAEARPGDVAACAACDLPYDTTRWSFPYLVKTASARLLRTGRK